MNKPKCFLIASGLMASSIAISGCGSSSNDNDDSSLNQIKITQDNATNVANSAMTTLRLIGQLVVGPLKSVC